MRPDCLIRVYYGLVCAKSRTIIEILSVDSDGLNQIARLLFVGALLENAFGELL